MPKFHVFSRFFSVQLPLRLECSRSRKTAMFLISHRLKKLKNLHPRSFTNGAKTWLQFFFGYLSEIKSVCSITLLILVLFTFRFYHFLFRRYLNSSVSSDILLAFPNSNDLNSHVIRKGASERVSLIGDWQSIYLA